MGSRPDDPERVEGSTTTIAAIVTSLGGPPGAVGIVRLSGPEAVAVASRVFRPAWKNKGKSLGSGSWRPTSHVVEYGVVSDHHGNVVDEVSSVFVSIIVLVCHFFNSVCSISLGII